ncbi:alpha/beta hydrolase [Neobacillus drentensis]|uniref:alpha/beta hydrolase n=1 Tax=Neobacillus drentensis TaxID=220684 RepID=UPI0030011877
MIEKQVEFKSDLILKGTLALPEKDGKFPAVIMLHGSGPGDRDSNVKGIKNIDVFNTFAKYFSEIGVASLRYDKRGVKESEGSYLECGMWDLVNDAVAGIRFLKNHPQIDNNKIIIMGHSEGCLLAPAVNKIEPVDGIVFLSGAVGSLSEAIDYQLGKFSEEIKMKKGFLGWLLRVLKADQRAVKQNKKTMYKVNRSKKTVMRISMVKINAKWIREHHQYDVGDDLPFVECPVLAITGSKDLQVNPDDAKKIASLVKGPSEYHILEGLNHILRNQEEDLSFLKIKKIYMKNLDKPLDSTLISLVNDWLKRTYLTEIMLEPKVGTLNLKEQIN